MPGERFEPPPAGCRGDERPFVAGDIADRGPLERGAAADRARDARPRGARARAPEGLARPGQRAPCRRSRPRRGRPRSTPTTLEDDDDLDALPLGVEEGERRRDAARAWRLAAADPAGPAPGHQPQAARAGGPRPRPAGGDRPRRRRGRRRHDAQQRVQAEDAAAPRGRGPGHADLRPQDQHDPADAVEPDLDLLAGDRPARGGAARDRGRDRGRAVVVRGRSSCRRRTPTSGGCSTRWPSGRTSCRARAAGSRTAGSGSTRTPPAAAGGDRRTRTAPATAGPPPVRHRAHRLRALGPPDRGARAGRSALDVVASRRADGRDERAGDSIVATLDGTATALRLGRVGDVVRDDAGPDVARGSAVGPGRHRPAWRTSCRSSRSSGQLDIFGALPLTNVADLFGQMAADLEGLDAQLARSPPTSMRTAWRSVTMPRRWRRWATGCRTVSDDLRGSAIGEGLDDLR